MNILFHKVFFRSKTSTTPFLFELTLIKIKPEHDQHSFAGQGSGRIGATALNFKT